MLDGPTLAHRVSVTVAGLPIDTIKLAAERPDPLSESIAFGDGPYVDVPGLATGDFLSFLLASMVGENQEDWSPFPSETAVATAGQGKTDLPRSVSPSGPQTLAPSNEKNSTLDASAAAIAPLAGGAPLGVLPPHHLAGGGAGFAAVLEPENDAGRFLAKPLRLPRPASACLELVPDPVRTPSRIGESPRKSLPSVRLVVAETSSVGRLIPTAQPSGAGKNGAAVHSVSPDPKGVLIPELRLFPGPTPAGGERAALQGLVAPLRAANGSVRPRNGADPLSFALRIEPRTRGAARLVDVQQGPVDSTPTAEGAVRVRKTPVISGGRSVPKSSVSAGAATLTKAEKQGRALPDTGTTDEGKAVLQPDHPGEAVRPGKIRSARLKGPDGKSIDRRSGGEPAPVRPADRGTQPHPPRLHPIHGVVERSGGQTAARADRPSESRGARPAELLHSLSDAESPARASAPVRHFAVKISADSEKSVSLSIVDRGGQLHVAVRTPEPELNAALGRHIDNLVARIESHGSRVDTWSPHGSRPLPHQAAPGSAEQRFSEGGGQDHPGGGADQRQGRQHRQQPGWVDERSSSASSAREFDEEVRQWLQASRV